MQPSLAKLQLLPKPLLLLLISVLSSPVTSEATTVTGDSWCGTLMCVTAAVNGSIVTYELKSLNQLGWMAIGFGTTMSNSAHVILWRNSDDTITLSQRRAPGQVEPLLDPAPPRLATLSPRRTNLSSPTTPTLAFNIPKNNDTLQQLVWAFGITPPFNSSPSADLEQHLDAGPFSLNLTKSLDVPDTPSTTPPSTTASNTSPNTSTPSSTSLQRRHDVTLTAHAILCFIGFLVLLPFSALLARWTRTRTTNWLKAHWMLNTVVAFPIIVVGWLLGPLSVSRRNRVHVVNEHQIFGVILFSLYAVQMTLGTLIHLRRPKNGGKVHPLRNVVHVVLGLVILVGSFFQVKTGISRDLELSAQAAQIATILWICWTIAVPMVYFAGLKHLKTQFDQERLGWHEPDVAPLAVQRAAAIRRPSEETLTERGRILVPPVLIDDGTHDIFSRRRANEPDPNATEMRELERPVPISIHT